MEKSKLTKFIQKYYLSGLVESVKWEIRDNAVKTTFVSSDSSVVGLVKMSDFECKDGDIGIYDTSKLNKLVSVLGDSISFDYQSIEDRAISIKMSDSGTKVNYTLADMSVIPKVPTLRQLPEFDVTINLDDNFISKFIRAKSALPEENTFTFECKNGNGNIIIGYSNVNTNRVSIAVDSNCNASVDPISFSAVFFKEILNANKDATNAVLKIATSGLAYIRFTIDEYDSEYYMVKVNV